MIQGALHFCGLNHVVVPLSLPYDSRRSPIGSLLMSLSWRAITRGEAFKDLEAAQEYCRMFESMNAYWVPLAVRHSSGSYRCSNRPVWPSSGLANSLGLTVPWVECARACIGESHLIPCVWKIKGGHVYSYSYTNYAPGTGAYIISILESHWPVLKIYVNLYGFFSSKCVVIMP